MDATISLDGILSFINSLSLSANNKQWLGEKLLEEAKQEKAQQSYADLVMQISFIAYAAHGKMTRVLQKR